VNGNARGGICPNRPRQCSPLDCESPAIAGRVDSERVRELIGRRGLLRSVSVVRFRLWLATLLALSGIVGSLLHAQLTDEEKAKRAQFLKARAAASATPDESPSPTPKSKTTKQKENREASPAPKPKARPSETPEPTASASPKKSPAKHKPTPGKSATSKKKKKTPKATPASKPATPLPKPSETPLASEVSALRALPVSTPSAAPTPPVVLPAAPVEEPAEVTIEKSGYEKRSWFSRLFGGGRRSGGGGFRYLNRSVRAAIDRAPVARARWQFIVVHNSGTRQGNAAVFDYYHRHVRRMQNGLAYHFVIGNGTSTGNGEIEVGDRWRRQINGGHVHSDYLNNIALGICLVGDFNRDQPTRAQLDCCEELVRYLRQRCGKIDNHYAIVKPHREMNPPRWPTDCPGDAFPYSWFRRF
jgi:N-acetylmuramoyl-L-alanine amidase